jgi:ribosomal protein L44E
MAEHYTKNTLECTAYCPKCNRFTQHRVTGGRKGPCIDPDHRVQEMTKAQRAARQKADQEKQNPKLFR